MNDRSLNPVTIRPNRPRGIYIPAEEAEAYIHAGWKLLDDCAFPPADEALLLPPEDQS